MNSGPSFLRRIATALMEHAIRVLPSARSEWAEAMQHEIHHIIAPDRGKSSELIGVFGPYRLQQRQVLLRTCASCKLGEAPAPLHQIFSAA